MKYASFYARALTFAECGWESPSDKSTPRKMAQAGFYAITKECVKCTYCGIEVDSWEADDDPMLEHQRLQFNCPFVLTFESPPKSISCMEAIRLKIASELLKNELEYEKMLNEVNLM